MSRVPVREGEREGERERESESGGGGVSGVWVKRGVRLPWMG